MRRAGISLIVAAVFGAAGCQTTGQRLNAPPHGEGDSQSQMQAEYVYMVDNGLLATMTVSDIHFMPDRPLLNSLGEERLRRLASLLEAYGGAIRFNSDVSDPQLLQRRSEAIVAFLQSCGIATAAESVRQEMAGGPGIEGTQAILIRTRGTMVAGQGAAAGGAAAGATGSTGGATR